MAPHWVVTVTIKNPATMSVYTIVSNRITCNFYTNPYCNEYKYTNSKSYTVRTNRYSYNYTNYYSYASLYLLFP